LKRSFPTVDEVDLRATRHGQVRPVYHPITLPTQANATLLVRHHVLSIGAEPALDDVFRALHAMCTYHMEVLPLASGRSGTVSGQVALHAGVGVPRGGVRLLPRSVALQYKLTDGGAVFFERGTGAGVL